MNSVKQYNAGDVIHSEKPFLYCLTSKMRTERCDFCFANGSMSKCSACKYVYYCGSDCQRNGWNLHKLECRNLKQIAPKIVPDAARLLARLIRILQRGGNEKQAFYGPNRRLRMYKDLMSHYPNVKNDPKRLDHFIALQGVLMEYFKGDDILPNSVELMGMFGRVCINSFNIMDEELQCLGTGVYLGASIFDHSCQPNAVVHFDGIVLHIRALEVVSSANWNNIFISYIDTLNTTSSRREELLLTYYFSCECEKCLSTDPPEILAAICPNTLNYCDHWVDPKTDKNCAKCHYSIPEEFRIRFDEIMEFTEMHLKQMERLAYFDVCMICLGKHKGLLHKFNVVHVKTLDLAVHSCIHLEKWEDAITFGQELIEAYYKYYGKLHPLTGVLHLKLGKMMMFQEKLIESMQHLKSAYEILKITHGPKSKLFREELLPLLQQAAIEAKVNFQ